MRNQGTLPVFGLFNKVVLVEMKIMYTTIA